MKSIPLEISKFHLYFQIDRKDAGKETKSVNVDLWRITFMLSIRSYNFLDKDYFTPATIKSSFQERPAEAIPEIFFSLSPGGVKTVMAVILSFIRVNAIPMS